MNHGRGAFLKIDVSHSLRWPATYNFFMQFLRLRYPIARLVLVWFALSLGVAIASPLANPQGMELVCTSANGMQLVVLGDEQPDVLGNHTLDCPLCATHGALPLVFKTTLTQPPPTMRALPQEQDAHITAITAPPLPSRGPPANSC